MAEAEADAREREFNQMSLHVFAANERALRLYKGLGYREIGRQPVVQHPRLIYKGDILLLTKEL